MIMACLKFLRTVGFKWIETKLKYTKKLRELHNDYYLEPKNIYI